MGKLAEESKAGEFLYLHNPGWSDAGILHGFGGCSFGAGLDSWLAHHGVQSVVSLKQVHGNKVIDLRRGGITTDLEGDALIVNVPDLAPTRSEGRILYLVKSADCVPVLCRLGEDFALIHAGWRGLACGVIERTLEALLRGTRQHKPLEIIIGPSAEACCYEVGVDVKEALSKHGAFYQCKHDLGKSTLSTSITAQNIIAAQIQNFSKEIGSTGEVTLSRAGLCTICDLRFHSYRREGKNSGRNFSFILGG